ncbi:MAG: type II secretion system protein GspM, partial [Gemmatimonadota bacterium]
RFVRLGRPLTGRERRVVFGGAAAVLVILLGMKIVVPAAGRWQGREDAIAAKAAELAKLEALIADSAALGQRAEALRRARAERQGALLEGGTSALAGSTLQSLIRGYGEASRVQIQRLDPVRPGGVGALAGVNGERQAAAVDASGRDDLVPVGLSLSGRGDIYGLVGFLGRLQNGGPLLVVDELRVRATVGGSRDELLNWTVRVTGFFTPAEGAI